MIESEGKVVAVVTLCVLPEGLAAAGAAVQAPPARLVAAHVAAASVVSSAADLVSVQTAVQFSA